MTAKDYIADVRKLLGKKYSEIDCIRVVVKPLGLSCAGTNWLWRSYKNSSKYQYLVQQHYGNPDENTPPGAILFKIANEVNEKYGDRPNAYHVGVYTGKSVIDSNPSTGVVERAYEPLAWQGWGLIRGVVAAPTEEPAESQPLTDHEMLVAIYNKMMEV